MIGSIVYAKNPHRKQNQTFSAFCASVAFWSFFYLFWQRATDARSALVYCRLLMLGAIWIPTFFFHYTAALLDQEHQQATLIRLSYALSAIVGILDITTSLVVTRVEARLGFQFWPIPGVALHLHLSMFAALVVFACVKIYQSIQHHSKGQIRTQLVYSLVATSLGFGGGAFNYLLWYSIPVRPVTNLAVSFYSVIIAYTILRHRLMDITVIVRKTLVYSMVMAPLAMVYIVILALSTRIFEGLAGYQTMFSSTIAASLIAFCFQPLKKRVQSFVDTKFFRQYVDREEKLYELSREVITHTTPEAMGGVLIRVLDESLHPKAAALFLRSRVGSGFSRVSSVGSFAFPDRMDEDNALAAYFKDHPQPFVQDKPDEDGHSLSTRIKKKRKDVS